MHTHIRLTGVSKTFQGKPGIKVELKLYEYAKYAGRKQLEKKQPPQTQTTNQYIIRLLKNENVPICLAACNIVFKSPFTVWCSFLSKLSSTNFIIFFHVRSDFNNCSCSFDLLVWKDKIFGFFKIYFRLLYGGFFKIKDQIKTPLSNCIQSVCSSDCKQFPYYVSLHPFLSLRKEWGTHTHTLSLTTLLFPRQNPL